MARKKPDPTDTPDIPDVSGTTTETTAEVAASDHGCAVYRDNAGKALGGGISEGAANFAAITEAARAIVVDNGTPNEAA